jgi:hypothetical protein
MPNRVRGFANYLLIAGLAFGAGAAGTWLLRTNAAPATPLDAVTTHGEYIWIKSGADSIWAYIAYPERSDRAPAMIVIHENRGLTAWEPTVADHLASKGYVAIAPDLVSSRFGPALALGDSVGRFLGQLQADGITADLNAVFDHLNALPSVRTGQIGAMGFSGAAATPSATPPTTPASRPPWSATAPTRRSRPSLASRPRYSACTARTTPASTPSSRPSWPRCSD